jgi:chromosome partitioning protein
MTTASDHGPKSIAIISQKGGQGKSAIALNLAHELAERDHTVALVDFDPNGHLSSDLGYRDWTTKTGRHAGAYLTDTTPNLSIDDITITTDYGWDLIPRIPNFSDWETYLWTNADPERSCLTPLYSALRNHYDYVVIDTGPSKNKLTDATLHSINYCMIPVRVGDAREVLTNTVQDLVYIQPDGADQPIPRVKVLAIFPTFIQNRIDTNTRDRFLIEELCQDDSTTNAVPNFAYIPQHRFDAIDAGDLDVLPRPGLRKAAAIDADQPLRDVDEDHEQLLCFEELARIAERGGVDRTQHPAVATRTDSETSSTETSSDAPATEADHSN